MSNNSFSRSSFYIGDKWRMDCATYSDTTPILCLDIGDGGLTISARGKAATAEAVQFARELARETRVFADEMERMQAEQIAADNPDTGCDAA